MGEDKKEQESKGPELFHKTLSWPCELEHTALVALSFPWFINLEKLCKALLPPHQGTQWDPRLPQLCNLRSGPQGLMGPVPFDSTDICDDGYG